jgi:hypothetical protein
VLERYREAIGGRAASAAKQHMYSVGEFSMPAAGITGTFESYASRPSKSATRVTLAGFGELRTGFDGDVAWSINPMEGPRVLQGAERAQTADDAQFDSTLRDASRYSTMETVERTRLAGRECIKVRLVSQAGQESFDCFSAETGLIVGSIARRETNMGTIDALTLYDEYRDFEGIRMPTRITLQVMGMDQVITLREVRFTAPPASTFELPAEIRALIR